MIKVVIIFLIVFLAILFSELYPEYKGGIVCLCFTLLTGAGIIKKEMFLKISLDDKDIIMALNIIFFIIGLVLTILYFTIWKANAVGMPTH